ncbi:MAG: MGH1-like glycoside hydrolase domain-containing protein [Rhizobiaceae bacterium]
MTVDTSALRDNAIAILRENDRGNYTVPTKGLYPFQWNWDSCLTAIGQNHFDEDRAWTEIETLMAHQWPCGMLPHIIFHEANDGYFPGPDVWQSGRPVPTTGITQPAVAGFALRLLYERSGNPAKVEARLRVLLPKVSRWHRWFFETRDPKGEGLVALIHPWESGRDNSVDWDEAFQRVPRTATRYVRKDILHADPAHRPTQEFYDRIVWLIEHFRSLKWDTSKLHDASPFQMVDPGFNAILLRACADVADMADMLGMTEIAKENRGYATRGIAAMESLWSEAHGQYLCRDRSSGTLVNSPSNAGLLAAFCAIPESRAARIAKTIESHGTKYRVASHPPQAPGFESKRYWRGPVWLVINYMIAEGLKQAGQTGAAAAITASSLDLIRKGGFAEYYDPQTGEACGGGRFTWTAAMVLEFLRMAERQEAQQ